MKLVVISPEQEDSREVAMLAELFAAGLARYHVRKRQWTAEQLRAWLRDLPPEWHSRLILHQHHELVAEFGLGGCHWRDEGLHEAIPNSASWRARLLPGRSADAEVGPPSPRQISDTVHRADRLKCPLPDASRRAFTSRSCHDLAALRTALGSHDSVFFSPVFPSISKRGYGPRSDFDFGTLAALLAARSVAERRTEVLALGGVKTENLPQVGALGFDGAAVCGAVWQASDPVAAFRALLLECRSGRSFTFK